MSEEYGTCGYHCGQPMPCILCQREDDEFDREQQEYERLAERSGCRFLFAEVPDAGCRCEACVWALGEDT